MMMATTALTKMVFRVKMGSKESLTARTKTSTPTKMKAKTMRMTLMSLTNIMMTIAMISKRMKKI